jgi:hypothetical protein
MPTRRGHHRPLLPRLLATAGVALLIGGTGFLVWSAVDPRGEPSAAPTQPAATDTTPATPPPAASKPKPRKPVAIRLRALGAYDPDGDRREQDELAPAATDGDAATAWRTERYRQFAKPGVGLVLDAGRRVVVKRLTVVSATPGYVAEVLKGNDPEGPFTRAARGKTMGARTVFALGGTRVRFLVLWITDVPDGTAADVNEVRAVG